MDTFSPSVCQSHSVRSSSVTRLGLGSTCSFAKQTASDCKTNHVTAANSLKPIVERRWVWRESRQSYARLARNVVCLWASYE